ncbi:DNA-directed DNA polymerase [Malassezia cuniculi]|uniref:DNA polymerase epsilon subunit D n=1 Tax=Malassezia cuniculi TaxID=948313 RepID=A0AAF0ERP5_9BASI|nr:DNA-directed DNA polymerase [Malassezia cuniculi]
MDPRSWPNSDAPNAYTGTPGAQPVPVPAPVPVPVPVPAGVPTHPDMYYTHAAGAAAPAPANELQNAAAPVPAVPAVHAPQTTLLMGAPYAAAPISAAHADDPSVSSDAAENAQSRAESPLSDPENIPLSVHQMTATNALGGTFGLGLDQFELPKAPVAKIARAEMPESMQLRKELNTALVKSASVFVSYLTAAAHDVATAKGNKTIAATHVQEALRELEFPGSIRRELRDQLAAFRALQKEKNEAAKLQRRAKQAKAMEVDGDTSAAGDTTVDDAVDDSVDVADESVDEHLDASMEM